MALKRANREKQRTLQELDEAWFHFDSHSSWSSQSFLSNDGNLWKDIEDQKLENQKLQRKTALRACQTQQLDSRRDALEKNLKELTDQLEAFEEFSIDEDKEQLQKMKSLQKVTGDQNLLLKVKFEKMTLGKWKNIRW